MLILLIDFPHELKNYLNLKFLSKGIKIKPFDNVTNLKKYIDQEKISKTKNLHIIIVYMKGLNNPFDQCLMQIKREFDEKCCKFIIVTGIKLTPNFIQTILFFNVLKIVQENHDNNYTYNQIYSVIENLGEVDKREYQRIYPDEKDEAICLFFYPDKNNPIRVNIVNISIGGVALAFKSLNHFSFFEQAKILDNCQLNIRGKNMIVSLNILLIVKKNLLIGARFYNPNYLFLMSLSQYLIKKIANETM